MRNLVMAFLAATMFSGCGVHVRTGHAAPLPPPPARPAPPRVVSAPEIRAREIDTNRIRARVIYAQVVRAEGGRIARVEGWNGGRSVGRDDRGRGQDRGNDRGRGDDRGRGKGSGNDRGRGPGFSWGAGDLSAPEIRADVVYVKELNARWIDADLVIAQRVHVGR